MRWSAWQTMRAGAQVLSGTSLALAVGCAGGEPTSAEKMRPMGLAAIEQVEEAAQEARRSPRYDTETALASVSTPAAEAPPSGDAPWFLRPVGQSQPGFVSETPPGVANVAIAPNVRPEPPRPPLQPIARPPRPRGGWVRAACGRG